jgi:hypothetical protein
MRPASLTRYSMAFYLLISFFPVNAETQLFQDAVFPYRISCKTEWIQEIKNDSTFQLKTTITGKKTRIQLKRYALPDSNGSREIMGWSRVNFAVNREIADKLGTVISSDSSINKKMGDLRAFELLALYLQTQASDSIWWGELSRWTEYRGYGYYVAVIGDTADLVNNRVAYKALLDSVSITAGVTALVPQREETIRQPLCVSQPRTGAVLDLLGRKFTRPADLSGAQLQVQRHRKRLFAVVPGNR